MNELLLGIVSLLLVSPRLEADDEKLSKRLDQLTIQLVKNLEALAKSYDEKNDPEAAHFLASCAIGFGSKDPKVATIKGSREVDLFVGKLRGGERLADANPIDTALRGIATDAKKLLDSLLPQLKEGELSPAAKNLVHDLVPKYEIARGAEEYIQATQRFNKLRRAMGLRGILWDFEKSRQLILACWYMGETGDFRGDEKSDGSSPLYGEGVELAKSQCARMVFRSLKDYPLDIRSYALVRQDLLNPDARRLWLAHWGGGKKINPMSVYSIPQVGIRQDIPTPSERYKRETVTELWPDWKDTEDTVVIGGVKVPIVRYPHDGESDVPATFSNGRGAMESGWGDSEQDFLAKAGVPIMLRIFVTGKPSDVSFEVGSKLGKAIPTRLYLNGDKRVSFAGDWITALALPEAHLDQGVEYTVRVTCKVNDTSVERTWSFKTRAK